MSEFNTSTKTINSYEEELHAYKFYVFHFISKKHRNVIVFYEFLRVFPYETKPLFSCFKSKKGTFGQHIIHFALTG